MPTTVFMSSTSRDLLDHRAALSTALLQAGFHPVDMAHFMARPEGAVSACLKEVAESDLFVGIYAWRYGFIPPEAETSITEQEFAEAQKLGKPCFCFLLAEDHPWPEEQVEKGIGARLLRGFKAQLDATLVRTTFTTPDDLAIKVLASLQRWQRDNSPTTPAEDLTPAANNTFNVGDIKAAVVTQGGTNTFGNLSFGNLDFSETTTQVSDGSTLVQGDQFSGNFAGNINIKSQLQDVTQSINDLPHVAPSKKDELLNLINELQQILALVPPAKVVEAKRIVQRVDALVQELEEEKPDKVLIDKTGTRLKKAAENLADVSPNVLSISNQIVDFVLQLVI